MNPFRKYTEEDEVYCHECDKPLELVVEYYEYWGSKFSQSHYECINEKCPECDDYDGSMEEEDDD